MKCKSDATTKLLKAHCIYYIHYIYMGKEYQNLSAIKHL